MALPTRMRADFSPEQDHALDLILAGKRAWTATRQLARRGVGEETLLSLESRGYLARWATDRLGHHLQAEHWTLTPWGAEMLGVWIEERGEAEVPYWTDEATDDPPRVTHAKGTSSLRHPERVPDRQPPPEYLADLGTGEKTEDPDAALSLFGKPLRIDRRLGRKRASGTERRRTGKNRVRKLRGE